MTVPASSSTPSSSTLVALSRQSRLTLGALVLLCGIGLGWSVMAEIKGAVIASGTLVVESNLRKIQHPTGGVVGAIHVREGQRVKAGELLLSLDDTLMRANLAIVVNELTAMRARLARLRAERDAAGAVGWPDDLSARALNDAETRQIVSGETALFEARRLMREGQRAQLGERISQMTLERDGLQAQQRALVQQAEVARSELRDMETLLQKNLVQRPRVTQLQREVIRIDGAIGDAVARLAQTAARVAEAELQRLQLDRDAMTENARETRETETRIVELNERRVAAEDQLRRVDLRSPIEGHVHQLTAHTVGGVVSPGDTIMQVVPLADSLVVEARIQPHDIDQLSTDQAAFLKFTAFNQRTTPEVTGRLHRISPDLARDPQTGTSHYMVTIHVDPSEKDKLKGLRLIPGMPVEAHLATNARTVASFLTKPLTDQFNRAMRER